LICIGCAVLRRAAERGWHTVTLEVASGSASTAKLYPLFFCPRCEEICNRIVAVLGPTAARKM
jgi:hypothetical protein